MEIPLIESGIARFQSPSILLHLKTLWTWAALILAALATFNSLIRRSKRVILRFRRVRSVIQLQSYSTCSDSSDEDEDEDDDDDDDSCSSSDDEHEDEDREEEKRSDFEKEEFEGSADTQGQNGESDHDHDWSGSVVRLWEGPDLKRDNENMRPFVSGGSDASPEILRVWDVRAPSATWRDEGLGRLVGIGRGNGNVACFGNRDMGKLTVVDLRNVTSPLAEAWWCGDRDGDRAVAGCYGDGLVSWCRDAAKCLTGS